MLVFSQCFEMGRVLQTGEPQFELAVKLKRLGKVCSFFSRLLFYIHFEDMFHNVHVKLWRFSNLRHVLWLIDRLLWRQKASIKYGSLCCHLHDCWNHYSLQVLNEEIMSNCLFSWQWSHLSVNLSRPFMVLSLLLTSFLNSAESFLWLEILGHVNSAETTTCVLLLTMNSWMIPLQLIREVFVLYHDIEDWFSEELLGSGNLLNGSIGLRESFSLYGSLG